MITVKINTKSNDIISINVTGHADSAPHGQDLACASMSLASVGIANQIASMGYIHNHSVDIELKEGYLKIKVNQSDHDLQLILETFEMIMKTLEESYHQYIQIMKTEV